jgi:hypothetical protein
VHPFARVKTISANFRCDQLQNVRLSVLVDFEAVRVPVRVILPANGHTILTASTIVADDKWPFWVVWVNVDRGMGRRVAGAARDEVLRNDLGPYVIVASEASGRNRP